MKKIKRILLLTMACIMMTSTVYATVTIKANKNGLSGSKLKIKLNSNDYATITITKGVDSNLCNVYIRVADADDSKTRASQQRLYNGNVTNNKQSYGTKFNKSTYTGKSYKMYAQIPTTAYWNTTTVEGEFTP